MTYLEITRRSDRTDRTDRALLPIAAPSRRTLLLGVGTLGAGLALGSGAATAAPPTLRPFRPHCSISAPAKCPSGLRKNEPALG